MDAWMHGWIPPLYTIFDTYLYICMCKYFCMLYINANVEKRLLSANGTVEIGSSFGQDQSLNSHPVPVPSEEF